MTSSTRHPAKTEPGPSSAASPGLSPVGLPGPGGGPCRRPRLPRRGGRGGPGLRPRRAGEGLRGGAERRPPGLGHLHGGRADPHRVARLQRLALAHALAVHERPIRRAEILDRQLAARVAGNAGVAAGKLVIVVQPPLSAHCPPDDELVLQREPATRGRAGGDHQLLGGHGHGARGVGHLQDRLAHLHHVAHVERPRSVDALAVHERPVRGPEVLDREESVGPRETRAWRREISRSPPSFPSSWGVSRPMNRSASTLRRLPRSLPSVTRSCSPAISLEP